MPTKTFDEIDDWLNLLDLDAIAEPTDKSEECKYFLSLAEIETDKDKFRWLISAFFGAAYSFFEINALRAYHDFHNPQNGEPIPNIEALDVLRRYVKVFQDTNRPTYVKTAGLHEITKELYELRKGNTHHYPLSILTAGPLAPQDFQFGYRSGKGVPALDFCRNVMLLIHETENELQKHY